jgi:hypothetical protein
MSNGTISRDKAELMKMAPIEARVDYLIDVTQEIIETCRNRPAECALHLQHAHHNEEMKEDAAGDTRATLSTMSTAAGTWLMWMVGSWAGKFVLGVGITVAAGSLMLLVNFIADRLFSP